MRKEWKMVCRVLMVVAALALATSAANAQGFKPRTLTLNCNNLAGPATLTDWVWNNGTPATPPTNGGLVTPTGFTVPTGLACPDGNGSNSTGVNQPLTDDAGNAILGVTYTVTFADGSTCTMSDFIKTFGDLLRFRDTCDTTGKNASVLVRVAN